MGNRAVPAANVWTIVLAMEKAFPVLISPAVDAVRAMTDGLHLTAEALALLWIQKVIPSGLMPTKRLALTSLLKLSRAQCFVPH